MSLDPAGAIHQLLKRALSRLPSVTNTNANDIFNLSQVTINILRNQNSLSINKRFVEALLSGVPLITPFNSYSQELVSRFSLSGVTFFNGADHLRELLSDPSSLLYCRPKVNKDFVSYFSYQTNTRRILEDCL